MCVKQNIIKKNHKYCVWCYFSCLSYVFLSPLCSPSDQMISRFQAQTANRFPEAASHDAFFYNIQASILLEFYALIHLLLRLQFTYIIFWLEDSRFSHLQKQRWNNPSLDLFSSLMYTAEGEQEGFKVGSPGFSSWVQNSSLKIANKRLIASCAALLVHWHEFVFFLPITDNFYFSCFVW